MPQRNAILRTLRSGDRGLDGSEVQLECVIEERGRCLVGAEEHLLFAVGFDESDLFGRSGGELQISERFRIHGEEAHCCAIFGGHIGNGGAIGHA